MTAQVRQRVGAVAILVALVVLGATTLGAPDEPTGNADAIVILGWIAGLLLAGFLWARWPVLPLALAAVVVASAVYDRGPRAPELDECDPSCGLPVEMFAIGGGVLAIFFVTSGWLLRRMLEAPIDTGL